MTKQTGRGDQSTESPETVASYVWSCFYEYFEVLGIARNDIRAYLEGKTLLEYGPGDFPGVALLMVAHGAEKVFCVDRFPLLNVSDKNRECLELLTSQLDSVGSDVLRAAFSKSKAAREWPGLSQVEYLVRPSGLSSLQGSVDLVYSRAVLEHVDDLPATFLDMERALRPGGTVIHQVDLKSHGLHRRNPLDFLTWPQPLWRMMYSHKGFPNRWRVDRYREVIGNSGLTVRSLTPTELARSSDIHEVRGHLDPVFAEISDEDLSWLGFWVVLEKQPRQ